MPRYMVIYVAKRSETDKKRDPTGHDHCHVFASHTIFGSYAEAEMYLQDCKPKLIGAVIVHINPVDLQDLVKSLVDIL